MRSSRIGFRAAALVVIWLRSTQAFRGRIAGILTDESKAVLPGANVALTNVGCLSR